jgi:predicted ester cyclase
MPDQLPKALTDYVAGLESHDVEKIASTLSDDLMFISATRVMNKSEALLMLGALYTAFPDWRYEYDEIENRGQNNFAIKWRQGGTHNGFWNLPGMDGIAPTGKQVRISPHYFYYRVANERLSIIFPEPVVGGAPRGILEQIGVNVPPL